MRRPHLGVRRRVRVAWLAVTDLRHWRSLHRLVAREGAVIAVEVPVRGRASEADRIEFAGVDDVRAAFRAPVGEEIEAEEQPARSETNAQGGDVARLVFRLEKPPSAASRPVARPSRSRRRVLAGAGAAMAIVLFLFFGLLPEVLGDWPYNAYGKDSRRHTTVHHHAPRSPTASASNTGVS